MTKRGGTISLCRILAPPQCPPSPYATILIYLNDREGTPLSFVEFYRLSNAPPHTPPTPQCLFLLMTERDAIIFCKILTPLNAPAPLTSVTSYYLTKTLHL